MLFLSVMHLRLRSARCLIPFMICALMSSRQARHSRSNLGVKLLRDANRAFWILTARQKDENLHSLIMAGSHRRAMPKLLDRCDEASVAD